MDRQAIIDYFEKSYKRQYSDKMANLLISITKKMNDDELAGKWRHELKINNFFIINKEASK